MGIGQEYYFSKRCPLRSKAYKRPLVLILPPILQVLAGCGPSEEQRDLVQKAKNKIAECQGVRGDVLTRRGKCLIWDLEKDGLHRAQGLLPRALRYTSGQGSVTVFLVAAKNSQQVGTYSVSGQPAYREWVNVSVVQMPELRAIGIHKVVSLDPRRRRPVQNKPDYGDPAPPIARWVESLRDAR